jgi:hypothetical protein
MTIRLEAGRKAGGRRRRWNTRLRRQMRRLERQAEAILAMNTDFHSRLKNYRKALVAGIRPFQLGIG